MAENGSEVLRLEGLPFRIREDEVNTFFEEPGFKVVATHLLLNRELRPAGVAYVELESEADASKAAERLNGSSIGDSERYVRIFPATRGELEWNLRRQDVMKSSTKSYFCVRMYGLPFRVHEYKVAMWFKDVAECLDVQIHMQRQGRPSGDATAYFKTAEDAAAAMAKDKADMDGRYINLSLDSVSATFDAREAMNSRNCIMMSGVPFRATEQELKDFFLPEAEAVSVKVVLNHEGRPSGSAVAEFGSEEEADKAMAKDRETLGTRFVVLSRDAESVRGGGGPPSYPRSGRNPYRQDYSQGDGEYRNGSGGYGVDSSRWTVKMSGLPWKATEDEIIDWFSPVAKCVGVRILKNRENRPSGEAFAEFEAEEDAKAALEKNRNYLGDRFVVLSLKNK